MSSFTKQFVLSLAQPYLTNQTDHVNSMLISKYLLKTGLEDPNRPMPSIGQSIKCNRKKKEDIRLKNIASNSGLKQVYTVCELSLIHQEITKLPNYDILGINSSIEYLASNRFICHVERGLYLPVMYKWQRKPLYSMIFLSKNHTDEEVSEFEKSLEKMNIYAVYHCGKAEIDYDMAQMIIARGNPEDTPGQNMYDVKRYKDSVALMANPEYPFCNFYCTTAKRWSDVNCNRPQLITIG